MKIDTLILINTLLKKERDEAAAAYEALKAERKQWLADNDLDSWDDVPEEMNLLIAEAADRESAAVDARIDFCAHSWH